MHNWTDKKFSRAILREKTRNISFPTAMELSPSPFARGNLSTISILLMVLGVMLSLSPLPQTATADTLDSLKKAEQEQKKKIDRIKENMSSKKEKLSRNKEQEFLLYNELKKIDENLLAQQQAHLNSQQRLLKQESFLEAKEIELNLILEDKEKTEVHIKNRLRAFYQMGEIGIINTIFSASTLPELLNTNEYFHYLFQYDKNIRKQYKNKLALLDGARQEILKGKETLLETIVEAKNQEKELIAFRNERSQLLKQVQTEEGLYKQALAEMQKSAADLSETFKLYRKKIITSEKEKKSLSRSVKPKSKISLSDFSSQKGKLRSPVNGGKVVTYFGKSKGVFGVDILSNGIDIQVDQDAQVKSVFKGIIVFAGELEGYGNVVIIDHGLQYFTLASRMNEINVKKGDRVEPGETIGTLRTEQSGLLQRGLHFEVRSGSSPEDPLLWLDKSQLSLGRKK